MNITPLIEQAAISSFVEVIGQGDIFSRIVSEIERTNASMPDATGKDKFNKVVADLEIIFDDLVEPIALNIIHLLIELGVAWLKSEVKAV